MEVVKDGRAWRLGTASDVDWLKGRPVDCTIASALPLVFDAYATFGPPDDEDWRTLERAVVAELVRHTAEQPWWLGYLDTGGDDIVFDQAPKLVLYAEWHYVLVQAGPEQALSWRGRHGGSPQSTRLPDLLFPVDRTWVVSTLWDDEWTCVGGPAELIAALQSRPLIGAREVRPDQDTTPPGSVCR